VLAFGLAFLAWKSLSPAPLDAVAGKATGAPVLIRDGSRTPLDQSAPLRNGDRLETDSHSTVQLHYADGTTITIHEDTACEVGLHPRTHAKRAFILRGQVSASVAQQPTDQPMVFESPNAAATVLGTKISLAVEEDETRLDVEEGLVELTRKEDGAKVPVPGGFFAEASKHKPLAARPLDSSLQVGGTKIPLQMPLDGKATIALYTKEGRLVRILGQMIELKKGEYTAQWDGMGLWGNLLPEGTELVCKLFANPGLKAIYEMSVGRGDRRGPAWLTRPIGEGLDMRTGGWLGDHTGPSAAAAIGDKVFLGCRVAEHGHSLIAVSLEGEKLWGAGLAGWGGPSELKATKEALFGRIGNSIYRVDPETYARRRLFSTGRDRLLNWTVHDDKLYLILKSHKSQTNPFRYSVSHRNIDYAASTPQMLGSTAPDWQISAQGRFSTTFNRGGHFQTGIRARVEKRGDGFITAIFQQPVPIGTIVFGVKGDDVARAEFWALKPGHKLDKRPKVHKEAEVEIDGPGDLDEGDALDLEGPGMGDEWQLIGKTEFPDRVSYVVAPEAGFKTRALTIRFVRAVSRMDRWRTGTNMCRVIDKQVERLKVRSKLILPADAKVKAHRDSTKRRERANGIAWRFRSAKPTSDLNPTDVIIDLGRPKSLDALSFLNIVNPIFTVSSFSGDGDPEEATEEQWQEVARYRARRSRKYGWSTASTYTNERYIFLPERVTARALRLRFTTGHLSGKSALSRTDNDPHRFGCDDLAFLRLLKERPRISDQLRFVWQERDAESGKEIRSTPAKQLEVSQLAFAEDGTLYTVHNNRLCRTEVKDEQMHHTVLNEGEIQRAMSMTIHKDQIVVADRNRRAILLFDRQGRLQSVIGEKDPLARGPWDPDKIGKMSALAIDSNDKLWIAESSYAPKRVARFSMDGRCEKEFFGPPEYGGGGYLDPNLKSFYYRGMEFDIDWEKGTSRLKNLNDRCYTEETPALEASTFSYTRIGYPIYYQGRKYIVGSGVICLMDGDVWRPCTVMGGAHGSVFLLRKEWRDHWKRMDLTGKAFLWCDLNGDGKYQIDEVDLFDTQEYGGYPFSWGYWGTKPGLDLTFWRSGFRILPTRITDRGVPIYEKARFERKGYGLPTYYRNITLGMRAKPDYGGFRWVAADGSVIQEGQPFVLRPDGTYRGGRPIIKPTNYIPPINGRVIEYPMSYTGGAVTDSPVGEVVVINGNNGVWSVVSVQDRVVLDHLFTGRDGGWSTDLPERRGLDVTGRKHGTETFFGNFIKAHNGNYYTVAGKGFHGICRIEGLDDYQVTTAPVEVTAEALAANTALRKILVAQAKAWEDAKQKRLAGRSRSIQHIDRRVKGALVELDGFPREWGSKSALQPIDEQWQPEHPAPRLFFDAAYGDDGLYLVYQGYSRTGNTCDDPDYLFTTGFCFDLQYRAEPGDGPRPQEGDRRIVFGKFKKRWIAVMYDYLNEKADPAGSRTFASPLVTTNVAKVYVIPEQELKLKVVEENMDLLGDEEELPGHDAWSAEVFLPWKTLGLKRPEELRCDVGVLSAGSGGITVEQRKTWADPSIHPVSDLGAEASITPGKWGTLKLK